MRIIIILALLCIAWPAQALTLTVYPVPTVTVDGYIYYLTGATTFNAIRTQVTGSATGITDTDSTWAQISGNAPGGTFTLMLRSVALFDTSPLTSGANISAATFSIFGSARASTVTDSVNVTTSNPASDTTLATSDYNVALYGSTALSTAITTGTWNTAAYNDFALNASGLSIISKTGITKLALRMTSDITNTAPTVGSGDAFVNGKFSDAGGTTNDPMLVITYTLGGADPISDDIILFN